MRNVFKRKDTWHIRYDESRGADGRRRQRMVACKGMNKKQAEEKLRQILSNIYNGAHVEPAHMVVADYMDQWLDRVRARLSPSTCDGYRKYLHLHVLPALGHHRLDKLRPVHIQALYDSMSKKGLSAKTVRNTHGIIHSALADGVKLQVLSHNPADSVTTPKRLKPEIAVASIEDIGAILSAVDSSVYRIPVLIVIATGVRRGEALGLQWQDFDPEHKTLAVRRSIAQTPGELHVKETKTGRSRVVMIPDNLVQALQEHRQTQATLGIDTPWICARMDGLVMKPGAFDEAFRRLRTKIGIKVSLHGLRHTQATQLMAAGVPVKVISERLGHSTVAITLDVYSHVSPHMQAEAVKVIEAVWDSVKKTSE